VGLSYVASKKYLLGLFASVRETRISVCPSPMLQQKCRICFEAELASHLCWGALRSVSPAMLAQLLNQPIDPNADISTRHFRKTMSSRLVLICNM
jgi:hypothetical protein